jgi:hypothetical protein
MDKIVFLLSFVIGLALLAIATLGGPDSGGLEAHAASMTETHCRMHTVELDQGYGISRTAVRRVCHYE